MKVAILLVFATTALLLEPAESIGKKWRDSCLPALYCALLQNDQWLRLLSSSGQECISSIRWGTDDTGWCHCNEREERQRMYFNYFVNSLKRHYHKEELRVHARIMMEWMVQKTEIEWNYYSERPGEASSAVTIDTYHVGNDLQYTIKLWLWCETLTSAVQAGALLTLFFAWNVSQTLEELEAKQSVMMHCVNATHPLLYQ